VAKNEEADEAALFSRLGPRGIIPLSMSTQYTLEKADLLGDYVDRRLFRELIGNRSSGVNRFELPDCIGEFSPRIRQ
jgi:hypothetical protein